MDFLQTGDLVLFKGTSWISYFLEWFGRCPYSHVGMIIRNPRFLNYDLEDGIYLLESGWNVIPDAEDHHVKYGVQLHFLSDIISLCPKGSILFRKIDCKRDYEFYSTLRDLHTKIHNKPYDLHLIDWLEAEYNLYYPVPLSDSHRATDRYWCSALVSYIYDQLGIVEPVNWTLVSPRELTSLGSLMKFRCPIGTEMILY